MYMLVYREDDICGDFQVTFWHTREEAVKEWKEFVEQHKASREKDDEISEENLCATFGDGKYSISVYLVVNDLRHGVIRATKNLKHNNELLQEFKPITNE